jgi:leader peptidase (prepilin peptidase) / N-methyltransferase
MEPALIAVCFVLGLVFGSFANVAIHRVPEGESVVRPPSACPECGQPIRPRDNVPVVSWVLLRGRCRDCGAPISARYPLVELVSGVLFAVTAWRFLLPETFPGTAAADPDPWALPAYLLFAWLLLVVAVIDARTRRIPNRLTYPLTPALLVLIVAAALFNGAPGDALRALLGGVAGFAALLVIALISPRGLGMGDVKLAAALGIGLGYLSWGHVVVGIFGGFLLGGLVAILLILTRLRSRKDLVPFGPYLAAAALLAVWFGDVVVRWYLNVSGIADLVG